MVRVRVLGDDPGELNALYGWLRDDPALARTAEVHAGSPPPDTMGALEVIDVVLTHATAVSGLAVAVLTWRRSRPRPTPFTLVRPDGTRLTVDDSAQLTPEVISEFLTAGAPAEEGPDGGERPPPA